MKGQISFFQKITDPQGHCYNKMTGLCPFLTCLLPYNTLFLAKFAPI